MNAVGTGEGWAEPQEQSIREASTGQDNRSEEDPVAAVAELMRWLVVRGKTTKVTAVKLPELVRLVGEVLEAMNVRAVRRRQVTEAHNGVEVLNDAETNQHGQRQGWPAEFTGAQWDAFAQALRRGEFDP